MSRSSREDISLFHSVEDELRFWKMNFCDIYKKYQRLLLCHTCTATDHDQEPVAKKPRIETLQNDNNDKDPVKLPEPCAHKIMGYLDAKELLRAMEVSKTWKQFIETRNSLMNQAMSKIVAEPQIAKFSFPLIKNIFSDSDKRQYKHMSGSVRQTRSFNYTKTIFPFSFYASTIETLSADYDDDTETDKSETSQVEGCSFPKLRKLKLYTSSDVSNWISASSFPELTHLLLSIDVSDDFEGYSYEVFKNMLQSCPKLKYLYINGIDDLEDILLTDDLDDPIQEDVQFQKIEGISLPHYHPKFLRDQKNSLKKLFVSWMSVEQISWCLRDLNELKSLTIKNITFEDEEDYQPNLSIETLKIQNDSELRGEYQDVLQSLQRLLLALPSLKELIISSKTFTTDLIQFIANNMRHLKKLICKDFDEEMLLAYNDVRNRPIRYINSTFEIIYDRKHTFDEISKEFNNFHA